MHPGRRDGRCQRYHRRTGWPRRREDEAEEQTRAGCRPTADTQQVAALANRQSALATRGVPHSHERACESSKDTNHINLLSIPGSIKR